VGGGDTILSTQGERDADGEEQRSDTRRPGKTPQGHGEIGEDAGGHTRGGTVSAIECQGEVGALGDSG
jgi:hypothetical protein